MAKQIKNNPGLKGQLAARKELFALSRYALAPVHSRFDAVTWFIWDAEQLDECGLPDVIFMSESEEEARAHVLKLERAFDDAVTESMWA